MAIVAYPWAPDPGDIVTMLHGVSGPISSTEHRVKYKSDADATGVRLAYSTDPDMEVGVQYTDPQNLDASNYHTADFTLTGLDPDTEYFWAPYGGGSLSQLGGRYGRFRTAPVGPKSFTIAFGNCNENDPPTPGNTPNDFTVWDHIREQEPDFFVHLDDFHYEDLSVEEVAPRVAADEQQMGMPRQGACYMRVPLIRGMGDHDFCGNDSHRTSTGNAEARATYLITMPHPPLDGANQDPTQGHWFALTWGRVRLLKIDGRCYRDGSGKTDNADKTMLGATQKTWLKDQLDAAAVDLAAGDIGLVIVAGDVPWTGAASGGNDAWSGYSTERAELAEYIELAGLTGNLYWIHGDMHRMGYDDGTNSRFSATNSGDPAFPVACGGSLGNSQGLVKGAYTDVEADRGENRAGFLMITDDGSASITVTTSLRAVHVVEPSAYTEPLGAFTNIFACTAWGS